MEKSISPPRVFTTNCSCGLLTDSSSVRFESGQRKMTWVGTCAQHVPGGGSSDGGPGTGFGAAFGSPDAATYK